MPVSRITISSLCISDYDIVSGALPKLTPIPNEIIWPFGTCGFLAPIATSAMAQTVGFKTREQTYFRHEVLPHGISMSIRDVEHTSLRLVTDLIDVYRTMSRVIAFSYLTVSLYCYLKLSITCKFFFPRLRKACRFYSQYLFSPWRNII